MALEARFTEISQPGAGSSFSNRDAWYSMNSNHVLALIQVDPGPNYYNIWTLGEITRDGVQALSTVVVDKAVDTYAYSDHASSERFTLGPDDDPSLREQMVLVEETATDLYFVIWTGKLFGESGWTTTGVGGGRRFVDGWTRSSLGLVPVRYSKTSGLVSLQSTSEKFTRWTDYVFVPESGGVNIVGNRPRASVSVDRTVPRPFAVLPMITALADGTYVGVWLGGGGYDTVQGSSSNGYNGWFQVRWQWNTSTKQVEIVSEHTVSYDPAGGEVYQPGPRIISVPQGNVGTGDGDVVVASNGKVARYDPDDPAGTCTFTSATTLNGSGTPTLVGWDPDTRRADLRFDDAANELVIFEFEDDYSPPFKAYLSRYTFTGRAVTQQVRYDLDVANYQAFEQTSRDGSRSFYHDLTVAVFEPSGNARYFSYFGHFNDDFYAGASTTFCYTLLFSGEDGALIAEEGREVTALYPSGLTTNDLVIGPSPAPSPARVLTDYDAGFGYSEGFAGLLPDGQPAAVIIATDDMSNWDLSDAQWRNHAFVFYPDLTPAPVIGAGERRARFVFGW